MLRALSFSLRSRLTWSPPPLLRRACLEDVLPRLSAEGQRRAIELAARYETSAWACCCDAIAWRESLYVLDILDRWVSDLPEGRALDVGAKNGSQLAGMATAVPRGWDAVEIDAHRRYLTGATRRAHGEQVARAFEGCRFIAGDARELRGPWALITMFLPFLTEAPHRAWGLPDDLLAPRGLLEHLVASLQPGGILLVVNQGEHEAEIQRGLFAALGVEAEELGLVRSTLSPFERPRYAFRYRSPSG